MVMPYKKHANLCSYATLLLFIIFIKNHLIRHDEIFPFLKYFDEIFLVITQLIESE